MSVVERFIVLTRHLSREIEDAGPRRVRIPASVDQKVIDAAAHVLRQDLVDIGGRVFVLVSRQVMAYAARDGVVRCPRCWAVHMASQDFLPVGSLTGIRDSECDICGIDISRQSM